MKLKSSVIKDIEVESGERGISLSQDEDHVLMTEEQLNQFLSVYESKQLAALREAGEKMAERLRALKTFQRVSQELDDMLTVDRIFVEEDADAIAEWEAANK